MLHFIRCKLTDLISDFVIKQLQIDKISYEIVDDQLFVRIHRDNPKRPRVLDELLWSLRPIMPDGMAVSLSDDYETYSSYCVHFGRRIDE